nr:hypothetical protein BaRGS_025956 [Batillaria attramentaria]
MALAALALHVLLTSVTGNQGNRRRHALVLGLFVLLSLPQPLSEVDMYDTRPVVCKTKNFLFTTRRQRHDYDIGIHVTTVFFPLFVFLVEFLATLAFNIKRGLVAAICCVPLSTVRVYMVNSAYRGIQADSVSSKTVQALTFLSFARPILTAIVCAETSVAIASVEVGLGAVCNLLLIFALAHTWKHWRQVKWYVILLTVGNVLEVGFTVGLYLGWLETETWSSSRHACKFLVFMSTLGPNLANMALAALALHVLLTSITGNQGNRLRHALVLGLFVLLSLPLPLTQIPMYDVQSFHTSGGYTSVCGNFLLTTDEQRLYYHIGFNVSIVFFPLFVFLVAFVATLILNFKGGTVRRLCELFVP